MSFARWLRATSEHYLMVAAQQKMAAKYQVYGVTPPRRPRGAEIFWLRLYVPAYRAVPGRFVRPSCAGCFGSWLLARSQGSRSEASLA